MSDWEYSVCFARNCAIVAGVWMWGFVLPVCGLLWLVGVV